MFKNYAKKSTKKTTPKTYKKKRFSKKKFTKSSTLSRTIIKPTTYSRELYQKLRWVKLESLTAPITSSIRRLYLGNSSSPYPPQGALTAFAVPAVAIPAGEQYAGGFVENGAYYDKFQVLGSSINVTGFCVNNTNGTNIILRVVLIPIMPSPDSATDTLEVMVNQLDGYTFDQLMSYPQASYKQVLSASSGHSQFRFKFFRKTKNMLQFDNIKGSTEQGCDMPDTAGAGGERPASQYQWGYYLRVFNSAGITVQCELTTEMKLYIRYFQRRYVQAITST